MHNIICRIDLMLCLLQNLEGPASSVETSSDYSLDSSLILSDLIDNGMLLNGDTLKILI